MSSKSRKLLEKMRRSKMSWKRQDIESLYLGFGFTIKGGGSHDKVSHPDFPQLVTMLPRHNKIARYMILQAVSLVDQLLILQRASEPIEQEDEESPDEQANESEEDNDE